MVAAVDETVEPISQLAESLEKTFHEEVGVNAYFSCGTTHGYPPHWDLHDVFVLQVAGRKDWTVGCVAVTDAEIREIWSLVPAGTAIVIHP